MKSENWLIVELGACVMALAVMAFFLEPRYEKCVWFIAGVLCTQFGNVMGYKFGKSMPQQAGDPKTGQTGQTETTTHATADTPPEAK